MRGNPVKEKRIIEENKDQLLLITIKLLEKLNIISTAETRIF